MNWKKLTAEAFKSKKFQENFLTQIREAVRDVCLGYCFAACLQFRESDFFPSNKELAACIRATKSHSSIILSKFKEWIRVNNVEDMTFKHNCSAFLLYGPLMSMYDNSTKNGDSTTREVVYKLLMPVYVQLGFKNYFQETFRHTVDINTKWPESTRKILQENCCVNLMGKKGKAIEMDAYVENEVVHSLKVYCSGHTTVKMCERLMGNIDLMKSVRMPIRVQTVSMYITPVEILNRILSLTI